MGNYTMYGQSNAGTLQVNSQLIPVPMSSAFFPNSASSPFYKGSGQPPPTVPLNYMSSAGTNNTTAVAMANPWSPTQSPLPFAIIALVVGMLLLRYVHWKG